MVTASCANYNCVHKLLLISLLLVALVVTVGVLVSLLAPYFLHEPRNECELQVLYANMSEYPDIFNASDAMLDYLSGYSDITGAFDPCDDFAKFACPYYRPRSFYKQGEFSEDCHPTTIFQRHNIQFHSQFFNAFMNIGSQAVRGILEPKYNWLGIVYDLYQACIAAVGNSNQTQLFDKEIIEQEQKIANIILNAEDHTAFADLYLETGIQFPFQLSYHKYLPWGVRISLRPIEPVVPYMIWFAWFEDRLSLTDFKTLLRSQNIEFDAVIHVEGQLASVAYNHGFDNKQLFAEGARSFAELPQEMNRFWNWTDYFARMPMDLPNNLNKLYVSKTLWNFANAVLPALEQLLIFNRTYLAEYLNYFVWARRYYPANASACWEFILQNFPEAPVMALDIRHHSYTEQLARKFADLNFDETYNKVFQKLELDRFPSRFEQENSFGIAEKFTNGWCEMWNRSNASIMSADYFKSIKILLETLNRTCNEQYSRLTKVARIFITSGAFIELQSASIHFGMPWLLPPRFNLFLNIAAQFGQTYSVLGHELAHRIYMVMTTSRGMLSLANVNKSDTFEQCLQEVYSQQDIVPGKFNVSLNGIGAYRENFADIVGLQLTFETYMLYNNARNVSGDSSTNFTDQQIFFLFLGMNQAFCRDFKDDANLIWQQLRDDHTVGANRLNILLQETPQFARAFKCPVGSRMNPRKTGQSCFDKWMNALAVEDTPEPGEDEDWFYENGSGVQLLNG